jgi:hypothetical protein
MQLEYAPATSSKRRRILRITIIAAFGGVLALLAVRTSMAAYERMRLQRLMQSCLSAPEMTDKTRIGQAALDWARLNGELGAPTFRASTLFVHERITPAGARLLIGVDLSGIVMGRPTLARMTIRVYAPASAFGMPQRVKMAVVPVALDDKAGDVNFQAGKCDPADDSHFTIEYTVDDRANVIDGWLLDGGEVKLEPR